MSLLSAHQLTHSYSSRTTGFQWRRTRHAVLSQVSLNIAPGETLALLGRSGCGKSTLARLLVGLESPEDGVVRFHGKDISRLDHAERLAFRRAVQMVFQDAPGAVNPRSTIGEIVGETLGPLTGLHGDAARERVIDLLRTVHLSPDDYNKLPQQMSGGQLQRVCIARALGPGPQLMILDEAVSNLDLHLQSQMLDLFEALQHSHGVSYLFVTHDLRLVERFCSRLIVMDHGRIVEESRVDQPLELHSAEGRALARAVLPAFPKPRIRPENTTRR